MTRDDLTPGQQATQATHAAFAFSAKHPHLMQEWHAGSNNLVLCQVPDEASLDSLMVEAHRRQIAFVPFYEPDFGDALTAVAFEPGPATSKLCANLRLALREVAMV